MDMHAGIWNRRKFLQVGAGMAAVAATGHAPANVFDRGKYYAVAAIRAEPSHGYLQSFIVNDRGWHPVDASPARAPGSLSMHPALPVVYACHDVALWDHLPRGAVSAFRLSTANGTLQLMGTQPLSLGAIHPQAATVTAHGRSLVALTRSGVYNVLPLAADGSLLPVAAIRKEYGRTTDTGSKTATPVHAVQHADGSLLAVDSGKETLSRFRLEADALAVQQRLHVHAGTGARQVALSSCGRWVYALHAQHASISVHRVTPDTILPAHQLLHGPSGQASMAISPTGDFLVRAEQDAVSVLPLDRRTGRLSEASSTVVARLHGLTWAPDSTELVGLDTSSSAVVTLPVHATSRTLGPPRTAAGIPVCTSLAFCLA